MYISEKSEQKNGILSPMIDPELKTHLEKIEKEVTVLRKELTSLWPVFMRGVFNGAGYIVGAALVLTLIGWVLNIVGVIPAFTQSVNEFRASVDRIGGTIR
jgi:hypothetical protein